MPGGTRSSWTGVKKLAYYPYTLPPRATRLRYQSNSALFFEICSNPSYYEKLLSYNLTSRETIVKANLSFVYSNKNTNTSGLVLEQSDEAERVENLLRVGFEVASRLLKKFWRPRRVLQRSIDDYVYNQFAGFYMIGIHLRYQYLSDSDVMLFAECAFKIENQV